LSEKLQVFPSKKKPPRPRHAARQGHVYFEGKGKRGGEGKKWSGGCTNGSREKICQSGFRPQRCRKALGKRTEKKKKKKGERGRGRIVQDGNRRLLHVPSSQMASMNRKEGKKEGKRIANKAHSASDTLFFIVEDDAPRIGARKVEKEPPEEKESRGVPLFEEKKEIRGGRRTETTFNPLAATSRGTFLGRGEKKKKKEKSGRHASLIRLLAMFVRISPNRHGTTGEKKKKKEGKGRCFCPRETGAKTGEKKQSQKEVRSLKWRTGKMKLRPSLTIPPVGGKKPSRGGKREKGWQATNMILHALIFNYTELREKGEKERKEKRGGPLQLDLSIRLIEILASWPQGARVERKAWRKKREVMPP